MDFDFFNSPKGGQNHRNEESPTLMTNLNTEMSLEITLIEEKALVLNLMFPLQVNIDLNFVNL